MNEVDKATTEEEIASVVGSMGVSESEEEKVELEFEFECDSEFVAEAQIGLGHVHVPVRGLSTMFLVSDDIYQGNAPLFLHMNEV